MSIFKPLVFDELFAAVNIIDKLHAETVKALPVSSGSREAGHAGVDPMAMSPIDFAAHVQREIINNAELVKAAGLKAQ